jgi:hypothetical protein
MTETNSTRVMSRRRKVIIVGVALVLTLVLGAVGGGVRSGQT